MENNRRVLKDIQARKLSRTKSVSIILNSNIKISTTDTKDETNKTGKENVPSRSSSTRKVRAASVDSKISVTSLRSRTKSEISQDIEKTAENIESNTKNVALKAQRKENVKIKPLINQTGDGTKKKVTSNTTINAQKNVKTNPVNVKLKEKLELPSSSHEGYATRSKYCASVDSKISVTSKSLDSLRGRTKSEISQDIEKTAENIESNTKNVALKAQRKENVKIKPLTNQTGDGTKKKVTSNTTINAQKNVKTNPVNIKLKEKVELPSSNQKGYATRSKYCAPLKAIHADSTILKKVTIRGQYPDETILKNVIIREEDPDETILKKVTIREKDPDETIFFSGDKHLLNFMEAPPSISFESLKPPTIYDSPKVTKTRGLCDEQFIPPSNYKIKFQYNLLRTVESYKKMLQNGKLIEAIIKRPAKKTKLVKRLSRRRSSECLKKYPNPNIVDAYTSDYVDTIVDYLFSIETNLVLRKSLVDFSVDISVRIANVDWIMTLLDQFDIHPSVFFMFVRIFDYELVKRLPKGDMYQLVAITSFWISCKYYLGDMFITVPKLFSLCGSLFSNLEIREMEIGILNDLSFNLNICDPLDFLMFYMKKENLENNKDLEFAAKFILECTTLFPEYSREIPSIWSEAAFYLARVLFTEKNYREIVLSKYNHPLPVQYCANLFIQQIKCLAEPDCRYKEVINRYSTNDTNDVAPRILKKIGDIKFL